MMKNKKNNEDCNGQSWKYSKEITCSLKQCSYEKKILNQHDKEDCWKSIKSILNSKENNCSCSDKFDDEMIGIDGDMLEQKVHPQHQDVPSVDLIIGLKGRDNNDKRLLCIECKCNTQKPSDKYVAGKKISALTKKYDQSKELLNNIISIPVCEVLIVLFSSQNIQQFKFNRNSQERAPNNHNFLFFVPQELYEKYFEQKVVS